MTRPASSSTMTTSLPEATLSDLQRETKTCRDTLQKALETYDVRSRSSQLEFARKALRNRYLMQLFQHTFSSRTRGIETHIWTNTSHPIVHKYRSHLSSIDVRVKALKASAAGRAEGGHSSGENDTKSGATHEPARLGRQRSQQQVLSQLGNAHAKVCQEFQTFLTEEEAFWRALARRMVLNYSLDEAATSVQALEEILAADDRAAEASADSALERVMLAHADRDASRAQGHVPANRQRLIEVVHKAFVCCGDLARYREQYRDTSQRDAKTRHSSRRGGRGGRGNGRESREQSPQLMSTHKDYHRAAMCYTQARYLLPSNGNSWNQLAVLASYRYDIFPSIYCYYRALCVRDPFEKARQNLDKVMQRAADKWQAKEEVYQATSGNSTARSLESLSHDLVALHSAFELKLQSMLTSNLPERCIRSLSTLLYEKQLGADAIVEVVVSAIATLWLRRMGRGNSPAPESTETATSSVVEQSILLHLCRLMCLLFDVSASEIRHVLEVEKGSTQPLPLLNAANISRRLPATVRRMLPALRILSKWLKGHIDYIQRLAAQSSQGTTQNSEGNSSVSAFNSHLETEADRMWSSYAGCINVLRFAFPFDCLPNVGTLGQSGISLDFEEDRDMLGFLPMKKSMRIEGSHDSVLSSLDPREEHLTRISDLLIDAKVVAETATSRIIFDDASNSFSSAQPSAQTRSVIDVTDATDTDAESSEDAVDLAMRAMHEQPLDSTDTDGGSEDEVILIPSRGNDADSSRPHLPPPDNRTAHQQAPVPQEAAVRGEPLTAQHLLLQVTNGQSAQSKKDEAAPPSWPFAAPNMPSAEAAWGTPKASELQHRSALFGTESDIWAPLGSASLQSAPARPDAQQIASNWPIAPSAGGDMTPPSQQVHPSVQHNVAPW